MQKPQRLWKYISIHKISAVCFLALVGMVLLSGLLWAASDEGENEDVTKEKDTDEVVTETKKEEPSENQVVIYGYKLIRTYPHNTRAFTQGLIFEDGTLYEGTGLYGQSALIKRDLKTNAVLKKIRLPHQYFGEGITLFDDKIYQLTWQSRKGFIYDKKTFRSLDEFSYKTEGWGLTHDGKQLILSDGTAVLRFLDPNTFEETKQLTVTYTGHPVDELNELEFINGQIYANVLGTYFIAIISPKNGRVTGWIDLRGLYTLPPHMPSNNVLNGIAYLPESKHLLVTGKRWPMMYEIEPVQRFVEQQP